MSGVESTKSKCPGQDTTFWKPGDIFDVECGNCGHEIEFFKDEASRRCSKCGTRVKNPKLSMGCAQWCEHAKECLGYDPKERMGEVENESGESLADELVTAMKREFGNDQKRIEHALAVLEHAEAIMKAEGGDPKVVLASAILHDIGIQEAERKHGSSAPKYQELEGPAIAERIMKEIGLDGSTISDVREIVGNHHSAGCRDTLEFRIVWDADWIVNFPEMYPDLESGAAAEKIGKLLRTETGRDRASKLYVSPDNNNKDG